MLLQSFLRDGGTPDDLLARYAIVAKRHREHPNLVLFKYNQIASPFAEPIVRECRGVILDESDNWRVVSRSFDKFFNYGEGHAAEIDWSTARVQRKEDGSLITVYHYAGKWHAATSGTPDAGGAIWGTEGGEWEPSPGVRLPMPRSFAEYFWQVAGVTPEWFNGEAEPDMCFMFELVGPLNRVVVQHQGARVVVLGAREVLGGGQFHAETASLMLGSRWPAVAEHRLSTIDGVLSSFESFSPLAQEGYVVVDKHFNRIKVKHPGYVALHHTKDGLGIRAFVDIARSGEVPEVIAAFPELKPQLDEVRARLDALVAEVERDYEALRGIETQKDFAIKATKTRCSAALFMLRAGKTPSVREYFAGVHVDQVMKLLGYKASEEQKPGGVE
jgi:hypothetical protein